MCVCASRRVRTVQQERGKKIPGNDVSRVLSPSRSESRKGLKRPVAAVGLSLQTKQGSFPWCQKHCEPVSCSLVPHRRVVLEVPHVRLEACVAFLGW